MKTVLKFIVAAIAVLSCSCITAQLSMSQHTSLNRDLKGKTYEFVHTNDQKSSLQFRTYKNLAASEIAKSGLSLTESGNPDYRVIMIYGIAGQQAMQRYEAEFGATSMGGTSYYNGRTPYGAYSGSVYTPPTFGVTGHTPVNYTEYRHRLLVIMHDRNGDTVYQGNAECSSEKANNDQMIPILIKNLLSGFPGKDGKAVDRVVPLSVRW